MNMYNFLVNIIVRIYCVQYAFAFSVQSYDVFSKGVSFAYGNDVNMTRMETAINQLLMKNSETYPMELFLLRHGKCAKKIGRDTLEIA